MDDIAVVGVLQGGSDVLDVGYHSVEGEAGATRMLLPQSAFGCVVHDEKRGPLLDSKVMDAHDLRVPQACERLSF